MTSYTAISFAPVQGFIEKSRKLRDLFGASLILSYLSYQIVQEAKDRDLEVISPGLINVQKGMPNRILIRGYFPKEEVAKKLTQSWKEVLEACRNWVEEKIPPQEKYRWHEIWRRWEKHTWELFWGHGESSGAAMENLETRKLRRDWTAINWTGESSSLTGADAIAWPGLGKEIIPERRPPNDKEKEEIKRLGRTFNEQEKKEIQEFYDRLAHYLDFNTPKDSPVEQMPTKRVSPQTKKLEDFKPEGKYIAPNERLSLPELVVRLVTYDELLKDKKIDIEKLPQGFTEIARMPTEDMPKGRWTGWFMGDGDKIGDKIKEIASTQGDEGIKTFSHTLRDWGKKFNQEFPKNNPGRIIYAGGDDFLGVLYRPKDEPELTALEVWEWLEKFPQEWQELHKELQEELGINMTFSVGLVWAAPGVPQRDVLQHCREAEKRAKKQGRDRVTIRVLFNSGQYVQWTCPWEFLPILRKYRDREGGNNWSHVYQDLAHLESRHAIDVQDEEEDVDDEVEEIALALFNVYFRGEGDKRAEQDHDYFYKKILEKYPAKERQKQLVNWIKDLIEVGWQLCSKL